MAKVSWRPNPDNLMCVLQLCRLPERCSRHLRQHGKPLHTVDIGETSIDEGTFNEYLAEISQHYTADKVRVHSLVPRLSC